MHSDASILHLHSSPVLQLHFRGHFRVHFCTPMPFFICGRTAMPLFYTYTHLWMYSGLYSAICGQFCIHFHTSTPTFICGRTGDISILHLHSSVDVQRFLQCYSYIFAAIFVYIYVHPHLHSSRPITCLVFKVAKSVATLHSSDRDFPLLHSLHSTSTFGEHFRIFDNAVNPQNFSLFHELPLQSSTLYHKHFRELLWVLNNAICCG